MIHEHYEPFFPTIPTTAPNTSPTIVRLQPGEWSPFPAPIESSYTLYWGNNPPKTVLDLFEAAVAAVRKLDEALGLADCDTAEKTEWMAKLRKAVRDHELAEIDKRLEGINP